MRCPYCHNAELQSMTADGTLSWDDAMDFLKRRRGQLDGVVISGGEPLAQHELAHALLKIKELGYDIALHTSGVFPDRLREVLPFISWVGLDVKAPFDAYERASGTEPSYNMGKRTEDALDLILSANIQLEVRTTTDPRVLTKGDILKIAASLRDKGVKTYALQEYRPANNGLTEPTAGDILSFYTDDKFIDQLKLLIPNVILRRS